MAKINKISVTATATLCVAIGVVLFSPGLAAEEDEPGLSPGPTYLFSDLVDPELPPEPSPWHSNFLDECAKKIYPECGEEIFAGMFSVDDVVLTKPCCARLVDMGKECHDAMVKALLAIPELKPDAARTLIKSDQMWKECDSDGAVSPS